MNGIAIARNLKSMGMSISDVSKATGLQEEEIKALWIYCNSIGFIGIGTTDSRQITNQRTCPYDSADPIEYIKTNIQNNFMKK